MRWIIAWIPLLGSRQPAHDDCRTPRVTARIWITRLGRDQSAEGPADGSAAPVEAVRVAPATMSIRVGAVEGPPFAARVELQLDALPRWKMAAADLAAEADRVAVDDV